MSGVSSYSRTCFQSTVTCCKNLLGFFLTLFAKCVCYTQALVKCSWANYVQSFISSVLLDAKPSRETLPLISDQLDQCTYLKSIPNQIKLGAGIINPSVCTEQQVFIGGYIKLVQRNYLCTKEPPAPSLSHVSGIYRNIFSNPGVGGGLVSFLPGSSLNWLIEE